MRVVFGLRRKGKALGGEAARCRAARLVGMSHEDRVHPVGADADLDLLQAVEDVQLGDAQARDAVDQDRAPEQRRVEPAAAARPAGDLSLIHISEPTRLLSLSYAVFCL